MCCSTPKAVPDNTGSGEVGKCESGSVPLPIKNVGLEVGAAVGDADGTELGFGVGLVHVNVGVLVGEADGAVDGAAEGSGVGWPRLKVGWAEGWSDGEHDGTEDGNGVGTPVCKQSSRRITRRRRTIIKGRSFVTGV